MHIEIPAPQAERLQRHAIAAGYESVESYVTEFVLNLAENPTAAELFAPLTEDELAASLAMIEKGMQQIDAGEGLTVDEARQRSLDRFERGRK